MGLAGFPDQAEISFPLPRTGHYLSGALVLDFDSQLTAHGDGLMTLSVNGAPRGQVVLDGGRASHQVRIELTPADLAGDRIVLHMAGRGTTNAGLACPTDATNSGSAVTLAADSRLELTSDQPLADAIGTLVAAPQPFVLSAERISSDVAFAIWTNQQLNRSGIESRMGVAGAGETPVKVSDHAVAAENAAPGNILAGQAAVDQMVAAAGETLPLPAGWPVSVADLGRDTTVKTFRGSRRWTIPFNAADLPGGALPEQFSLRLATTPLAGDNEWVVRVALNGNLIDAQRRAGRTEAIALNVTLPAERLLPNNVLVVELVDTTPNEGICARGPDAQAQLLPESILSDSAASSLAWASLIESLAADPRISLAAWEALSPVQSTRASDLLALILPRNARLSFDAQGDAALTVTTRGNLAQQLAGISIDTGIRAVLPASAGAPPIVVSVPSAAFGMALERLGADDVIILATGL